MSALPPTQFIPAEAETLIKRMARLERGGFREIAAARRFGYGGKYIPHEVVLWCRDRGWIELVRGAFEVVDWGTFKLTKAGYEAAGEVPPPWV